MLPRMKNETYISYINKFPNASILVYGDAMLDLYVNGRAERISPEAPVPVVLEESRQYFLGGAGNVAGNIASLGGKAALLGAVGFDEESVIIGNLCAKKGIEDYLVRDRKRVTPRKTRILSGHHQLIRVDREISAPISSDAEKKIIKKIKGLPNFDFVIISDYAKGSVTEGAVKALKNKFGSAKIIVNIKPLTRLAFYKNVYAVTLNAKEAYHITQVDTGTSSGAAEAARILSGKFQSSVILTRGEQGMCAYDRSRKKSAHINSSAVQVFDVTGAGDTVIAAFALASSGGASITMAAEIANKAAAISVSRRGTYAPEFKELVAQFAERL